MSGRQPDDNDVDRYLDELENAAYESAQPGGWADRRAERAHDSDRWQAEADRRADARRRAAAKPTQEGSR